MYLCVVIVGGFGYSGEYEAQVVDEGHDFGSDCGGEIHLRHSVYLFVSEGKGTTPLCQLLTQQIIFCGILGCRPQNRPNMWTGR